VPVVGGGVGCYWAFSVGQAVVEIGGDGADEWSGQTWVNACIALLSSFSLFFFLTSSFSEYRCAFA
jgi:hypothetical protein